MNKVDITKRHTLKDEHPCQFCQYIGRCGYDVIFDNLTDNIKIDKCRPYYYFKLLQQYENEKFDN